MFYGYQIDQWIGLSEWFGIVLVLCIGTFVVSCICANKLTHKKNRKYNKKNAKRKSYFIDVA
jgi:hypothetical protein